MESDDRPRRDATGTQTLERGLDLLERIAAAPLSVTQLADSAQLPRTAVARLVRGLEDRGFVERARDGYMRPGPKLLHLYHLARDGVCLVATARPFLASLSASTGLCAFLGRRDGVESVHLYRSQGNERMVVATMAGARRHLAETGIGKALILDDGPAAWARLFARTGPQHRPADWRAGMLASAEAGVVLQRGPPPDTIHSIAAPIRDASGRIVAAISVAAPAQYLEDARMAAIAPEVREAALGVSRELGFSGDRLSG